MLTRVQPGSIVLFHNAAEHTPEALAGIIEALIADGYSIIPISQMILPGDTSIDPNGRQCPATAGEGHEQKMKAGPRPAFVAFCAQNAIMEKKSPPAGRFRSKHLWKISRKSPCSSTPTTRSCPSWSRAARGIDLRPHRREKAYGNWRKDSLKNWEPELKRLAIRAEQQFDYVTGKNTTDIAMVIGAMDLLHNNMYDALVLVSSDSDFTPLAIRLRESGLYIIGAA